MTRDTCLEASANSGCGTSNCHLTLDVFAHYYYVNDAQDKSRSYVMIEQFCACIKQLEHAFHQECSIAGLWDTVSAKIQLQDADAAFSFMHRWQCNIIKPSRPTMFGLNHIQPDAPCIWGRQSGVGWTSCTCCCACTVWCKTFIMLEHALVVFQCYTKTRTFSSTCLLLAI